MSIGTLRPACWPIFFDLLCGAGARRVDRPAGPGSEEASRVLSGAGPRTAPQIPCIVAEPKLLVHILLHASDRCRRVVVALTGHGLFSFVVGDGLIIFFSA